jgi:hypothetical protein
LFFVYDDADLRAARIEELLSKELAEAKEREEKEIADCGLRSEDIGDFRLAIADFEIAGRQVRQGQSNRGNPHRRLICNRKIANRQFSI